jgi:hypothetical protein
LIAEPSNPKSACEEDSSKNSGCVREEVGRATGTKKATGRTGTKSSAHIGTFTLLE